MNAHTGQHAIGWLTGIGATLLFAAGCAEETDQTPPDSPTTTSSSTGGVETQPRVRFEIASTGLPESGMWKCDPVLVDINGDGALDLAAIPRLGDGPKVWLNDGNGGWTPSHDGLDPGDTSCGGGVGFGDFNEDGHLDLAAGDHCHGIFVYLGDGAGKWTMVVEAMYPEDLVVNPGKVNQYVGAEDIAVGDVDGDGHLDLVTGGSDESGINVYLGDGTGRTFTRQRNTIPTTGWANRVVLEDVTGDGHLDLIASYAEGPRVWHNDGSGKWTLASVGLPSPMMLGLYTGVGVGDVNGDERPDIALANWVDGPEVYLQQEDGSWQKSPDIFPEMLGGAMGLALGDVNRDGNLDIVTAGRLAPEGGYVRGVFCLLGDGAGGWTWEENSELPSTGLSATAGVTIGDVNGDGVNDVVAASGLLVETVPGRTEPILPHRVLVWRSQVTHTDAAAHAGN
ncbi:MAG: VCBS repeat-containing protein [Phycisphaerales bacterium]|nr:VCBS repeat-containing protein [Phycisphaerales bacterium]